MVSDTLSPIFEAAGCTLINPAILQPADPFLNAAGEALRRRLFITQSMDGEALCLRPEFTIPVCLQHQGGAARYYYHGNVFRQRDVHPVEFAQAGVEVIGETDLAKADAEMVQLALQAVRALSDCKPKIRLGDPAFFDDLVKPIGLPTIWRERLARAFGDDALVTKVLDRMADNTPGAMAGSDTKTVTDVTDEVQALLVSHGLADVNGRTADEIATRYIKKRDEQAGVAGQVIGLCKLFLEIECDATKVAEIFSYFGEEHSLDFSTALDAFDERMKAGLGDIDVPIEFSARFGRRLDYYSGFVFEIYDADDVSQRPLAGGGRYDRLTEMLGGEARPAVGFSLWLDRLGEAT